jgi:hypothetical protein
MITSKKLLVIAASMLALATGASAQVAIGGYMATSWTHTNGTPTDRFDIDSALLKFTGKDGAATGVVSLYYVPGSAFATDSDIHILDAYINWDLGSGWSVTGGRYLSWLGYESFFTINNPEISGANTVPGFIPGYQQGVRFTYSDKDWSAGLGVADSAFTSPSAFKGDGELKTDYAVEAFISYTGIQDLTLWLGGAYEPQPGAAGAKATIDLWAQYQVSKELYLAAEYTVSDNVIGVAGDSSTWLVLANYTFNEQVSTAFRVSGDTFNGPAVDVLKYTLAPTYTVNKSFSVRAEASYSVNYGSATANTTFLGVQALFKF